MLGVEDGDVFEDVAVAFEALEPLEHGICYNIRLCKVRRPPETPAFFAVVVYGLCLLLREPQPHQVFHAHRVGVEGETLHPPRPLPLPLHLRFVGGVPPHHDSLSLSGSPKVPLAPATKMLPHFQSRSGYLRASGLSGSIRAEETDGEGLVDYIDRVRRVTQGGDTEGCRPVDEQGRLITDYEESEGDGAHFEDTGRRLTFRRFLLHDPSPPCTCYDAHGAPRRACRQLQLQSLP